MGYALGGGSGWVLLSWLPRDGRLVNQYASDHSQAIAGGVPIVALDMYEHAYHIDFGANAKAYVDTFLRNVDWKAVEGRLEDARRCCRRGRWCRRSSATCRASASRKCARCWRKASVQLIDTRPKHFVSRQQDIAEGVVWRDPERVGEWMDELSKEKPVVVYARTAFTSAAARPSRCATRASTPAT
jgi:Fe-Mn family superoxide dismutase